MESTTRSPSPVRAAHARYILGLGFLARFRFSIDSNNGFHILEAPWTTLTRSKRSGIIQA